MWKKKVEAGVLLYALLMVAIFSLMLAFYLNRQVATQRNLILEREKVTAYALALLSQKEGAVTNVGSSQTKVEGDWIKVQVELQSGRSYQFSFPKEKEEEVKKETKESVEKEQEKSARKEQGLTEEGDSSLVEQLPSSS